MKYNAIILAAGLSSRAGGFKPLFKFGESTLIECAITPFLEICDSVIVVTGYRAEDISKVVEGYSKVKIVYNENHLEGMFSSIKCGLEQITGERVFITPGDYPFLDEDVCKGLLTVDDDIVIPSFNKRRGHPVLIKGKIAKEVLLSEDESLRDFFKNKEITYIDVSENGILKDIDTNDDYVRALKRGRDDRVKI